MKKLTNFIYKQPIYIKLILTFFWLAFLSTTDSYFEPYLLVACFSIFSMFKNKDQCLELTKLDIFISILLSLFISLANYSFFSYLVEYSSIGVVFDVFYALVITLIGYYLFVEILLFITNYDKKISIKNNQIADKKISKKFFLYSFLAMFIINTFVFIACRYPGTLTKDSLNQLTQALTGEYSNHHPFYHTLIIKLCVLVGSLFSDNLYIQVAFYTEFSIIVMALIFSYVIKNIYELSSNFKLTLIIAIWYVIMPFHMEYSYTMSKDVFFGGFATLFATASYLVLKNKATTLDLILMILGGLGVCLFRNNGFIAYILCAIISIFLFKKHKKFLITLFGILLVSFILKYPVLNALSIEPTEACESLAIPIQQISRVLSDGGELTDNQENLISELADIDEIIEVYAPHIVDPVKRLIVNGGNDYKIKENAFEYFKLWIQLGLKYPTSYISAWIDETRGYFNAGYEYWTYSSGVKPNTLGLERIVNIPAILSLFGTYTFVLFIMPGFRTFLCIGLYTWLTVLSMWRSIKQKNNEALFVNLIFIFIVLTLLLATPVFCEFRYAYALFCGMPFISLSSSKYFKN